MNNILLNEYSFSTFLLFVFTFIITVYLFSFKNPNKRIVYLRGFYINISLLFLSGFIGISLNMKSADHFIVLQHMFGQFALVFLLFFVYSFQKSKQKLEFLIVSFFSITIATLGAAQILYGIFNNLYYDDKDISWLSFIATLEFLWAFITLVRKIWYLSRKYKETPEKNKVKYIIDRIITTFLKPNNKESKFLLKFAYLMVFSSLLSFMVFFSVRGLIPREIHNIVFTEGSALFFFLFVLFYIDHSDTPISLISKVVGISLVSLLLLLNLIGYFMVRETKRTHEKNNLLKVRLCKSNILLNDFSNLPENTSYILRFNKIKNFPSNYFSVLYSLKNWHDEKFIYADNERLRKNYHNNIFFWTKVNRNHKNLYYQKVKYFAYFFKIKDKIYEVGLNPLNYTLSIHFLIKNILIVVIITILFVLFLFPLFFKTNVLSPMRNLLEGVKKIDKGDFDVEIPIRVRDEFGILSSAFTNMAKSIKKYRMELLEYSKNLEKKVEERTAALEIKNKKLKEIQKELAQAAKTDPLTGLFNRRAMYQKIDFEIVRFKRSGKIFSFIMSDIDDFKKINDNYGHDCGDYTLKRITKILKKGLRGQDTVSRWGGEEFLILLPETEVNGAKKVAEKLRKMIESHPFNFENIEFKTTMTFGISQYIHDLGIDQTIKRADEALYKGKTSGKNKVIKL
jgi:diguanylate cyclase (GGDEF)-like protein